VGMKAPAPPRAFRSPPHEEGRKKASRLALFGISYITQRSLATPREQSHGENDPIR